MAADSVEEEGAAKSVDLAELSFPFTAPNPQRCAFRRSMSKGLAPDTVRLHCFKYCFKSFTLNSSSLLGKSS